MCCFTGCERTKRDNTVKKMTSHRLCKDGGIPHMLPWTNLNLNHVLFGDISTKSCCGTVLSVFQVYLHATESDGFSAAAEMRHFCSLLCSQLPVQRLPQPADQLPGGVHRVPVQHHRERGLQPVVRLHHRGGDHAQQVRGQHSNLYSAFHLQGGGGGGADEISIS